MRCPFCRCRSLTPVSVTQDVYVCNECGEHFSRERAFGYDAPKGNTVLVAILLIVIGCVGLVGLLVG